MTAVAGPVRLLVASRNAAKLVELRRVLAEAAVSGIEVVGLDDLPEFPEEPEDGDTFEANALIKARAGAAATGLPCVADDSGLVVEALGGRPGVYSARYAGAHGLDEANLRRVLEELVDVPAGRRGAAFVSACALVTSGGEIVTRGEWPGAIAADPRGAGGFGYDPIFVPEGLDVTAAELSPEEKDARSHRGRALRALLPALRGLTGEPSK